MQLTIGDLLGPCRVASVSWVLQIYPALTRRRALALRLALLRGANSTADILDQHPGFTAQLLESIATDTMRVCVDLTQYTETYYFRENDEARSLPAMAEYAVQLSQLGARSHHGEVRLAAALLSAALEDLATLIDDQFLHTGSVASRVFAEYAAEQHPQRR